MGFTFSRVATRAVVVCVVVVAALLSTAFRPTSASASTKVRASRATVVIPKVGRSAERRDVDRVVATKLRTEEGALLAYAPSKRAPVAPSTVVYLHGVHGLAERGCPHMRNGASAVGWLVCPEAIEKDDAGMYSWGADVFEQSAVVASALKAARAQGASAKPGVAVGFSQGGFVAVDLVNARLAKFRGLVILGADVHPSPKALKAAGVVRIALGAGKADATYAALQEETSRLASEGIDVRFFDLGDVGHTYAAENTDALRTAIAWAGGAE